MKEENGGGTKGGVEARGGGGVVKAESWRSQRDQDDRVIGMVQPGRHQTHKRELISAWDAHNQLELTAPCLFNGGNISRDEP